jgi:hypothetical protein
VLTCLRTHACSDIQLLVDEVFKGLYFQDEIMKKYMEAFPEILFIDGTYCHAAIFFGACK